MENVPIYIKIEEYKELVDLLSMMREKLEQARHTLTKISEVKTQEDEIITGWAHDLEEVGTRVDDIDKSLVHQ